MADEIIKKVRLKDPVTGAYLHPETDVSVPTKLSELTNDTGFITASAVGNGTLTVQKNGASVGTFTANAKDNKTINITVPTSAADVSALPSSTKYAASMDLSIDPATYIITAQLKDQDGTALGVAQTIDLPLESVVVNGSYDKTNKKIVLTLESGSTIDIPVGDLIAGLQTEITSTNKLSADLIADGTTNKVVTATEKTTWNGKQNAIADLDTIRSGASAGATAVQPGDLATVATSGSYEDLTDLPTIDAALSSTSTNAVQNKVINTALAGKAAASHTHAASEVTGLAKVATSGSYADLTNKPTIPAAVTETTVSGWGFTKNAGTVTSVKINGTTKNPTSGVVDLGTVLTAHQDISGKLDVTTYNADRVFNTSTVSTSTNIVNASVTCDLIDSICAQLDAKTTEWTPAD